MPSPTPNPQWFNFISNGEFLSIIINLILAAAAIGAIIVTIKYSRLTSKLNEMALKSDLFDRRYEMYLYLGTNNLDFFINKESISDIQKKLNKSNFLFKPYIGEVIDDFVIDILEVKILIKNQNISPTELEAQEKKLSRKLGKICDLLKGELKFYEDNKSTNTIMGIKK